MVIYFLRKIPSVCMTRRLPLYHNFFCYLVRKWVVWYQVIFSVLSGSLAINIITLFTMYLNTRFISPSGFRRLVETNIHLLTPSYTSKLTSRFLVPTSPPHPPIHHICFRSSVSSCFERVPVHSSTSSSCPVLLTPQSLLVRCPHLSFVWHPSEKRVWFLDLK